MPAFSNWKFFLHDFLKFFNQINIAKWQDWVLIFLFFNMGAMLGPSWQDLKNVWILIIILAFIPSAFFTHLGLLAAALILMNIVLQIFLIIIVSVIKIVYP
jgi:hypothetical protein